MPRSAQFDHDLVLAKCARLFWRSGYSGTGISALQRHSRLSRSSLYAAFGSKAGLFDAALEWAWRAYAGARQKLLERRKPMRANLRAYFEDQIRVAAGTDHPGGCLFTNTSAQLPGAPRATREFVRARERELRLSFEAAIAHAQAVGELDRRVSPAALAEYLSTLSFGLNVKCALHGDGLAARGVLDVVEQLLFTKPQPHSGADHHA